MPDSPVVLGRVSFVSRFNRILAVVIWALAVFVIVATVVAVPKSIATAVLFAALVALIDWIVFWRPRLDLDDESIVVLNLVRRVTVPWEALIHVDTKYALTLHTPGKKVAVWVAPAPGRAGAAVARRQARSGNVAPRATFGGKAAPGDLLTTDSGAAAELVRERWETLRESGRLELGQADQVRLRVQWLWAPAVLTLALLVATVVATRIN